MVEKLIHPALQLCSVPVPDRPGTVCHTGHPGFKDLWMARHTHGLCGQPVLVGRSGCEWGTPWGLMKVLNFSHSASSSACGVLPKSLSSLRTRSCTPSGDVGRMFGADRGSLAAHGCLQSPSAACASVALQSTGTTRSGRQPAARAATCSTRSSNGAIAELWYRSRAWT